MPATEEIRQAIEKRLKEIDDEVRALDELALERERLERFLAELSASPPASTSRRVGDGQPEPGSRRRARGRPRGQRSGGRKPHGSNLQAIGAFLEANPGATAASISDATGIGRSVIYSALSRMVDNGRLDREELGDGQVVYRLRDAGQAT